MILGSTGKNFAAGMSGGVAFVLDEKNQLYKNLNKEIVCMEAVEQKNDIEDLKRIIADHVRYTDSAKGKEILDHFEEYIGHFKKIIPADYKEIRGLIAKNEEKGLTQEQAGIEAFKEFIG